MIPFTYIGPNYWTCSPWGHAAWYIEEPEYNRWCWIPRLDNPVEVWQE